MPKLASDKRWESFNKRLEVAMNSGDFWNIGTIYYEMADFLKSEGKDNSKMRDLGYEMKSRHHERDLNRYIKSEVINQVEILGTNDSCDFCKKLNGKRLDFKDLFKAKLVPVKECSHRYGCRCIYIPVVH